MEGAARLNRFWTPPAAEPNARRLTRNLLGAGIITAGYPHLQYGLQTCMAPRSSQLVYVQHFLSVCRGPFAEPIAQTFHILRSLSDIANSALFFRRMKTRLFVLFDIGSRHRAGCKCNLSVVSTSVDIFHDRELFLLLANDVCGGLCTGK